MSIEKIQTFVSTEWVASILDNKNFKIIDLRMKEKYEEAHIPGSVHIDSSVFIPKNEDGFNTLPDKKIVVNSLQEKGVNKENTIIFVDDVFNLNCSLATWSLHYFKFTNVKLIDGALAKWENENLPMGNNTLEIERGNFDLDGCNEEILITSDEILISLKLGNFTFVDNRSIYAIEMDNMGSNIPNSLQYWWMELFEELPDYFILKAFSNIEHSLISKGITREKDIVVYCESAPQSALVYLILKEMGYSKVKLYLAGYDEWSVHCSYI